MANNMYRIYRPGESYEVNGSSRNDAIFQLHIKTGMPEDYIKKNFFVKKIYG